MPLSNLSSCLPSSSAARAVTIVLVATIGFGAIVKSSKLPTSPLIPPLLRCIPIFAGQKHWPPPLAVAFCTNISLQRGPKLISWYEDEKQREQDIKIRGIKEHSIAVEKWLNEEAYRHIPRSLVLPCQVDFDVEPRLIATNELEYGSMSINEAKALVIERLQVHTPRYHQLLLTQHSHWDAPRTPVLVTNSTPQYHTYDAFLAQHARLFTEILEAKALENTTSFDIVSRSTISIDFRHLMYFGIPPPGFENCIEPITPPAPYEEPPYKLPLRLNAPRQIVIPPMPLPSPNSVSTSYYITVDGTLSTSIPKLPSSSRHHHVQRFMAIRAWNAIPTSSPNNSIEDTKDPEAVDYIRSKPFMIAMSHKYDEEFVATHTRETVLKWLDSGVKYWDMYPQEYEERHEGKEWAVTREEWLNNWGTIESSASPVSWNETSASSQTSYEEEVQSDPAVLYDPVFVKMGPKKTTREETSNAKYADPTIIRAIVENRNIDQDFVVIHAEVKDPFDSTHPVAQRFFGDFSNIQDAYVRKLNELATGLPVSRPPPGLGLDAQQNVQHWTQLQQQPYEHQPWTPELTPPPPGWDRAAVQVGIDQYENWKLEHERIPPPGYGFGKHHCVHGCQDQPTPELTPPTLRFAPEDVHVGINQYAKWKLNRPHAAGPPGLSITAHPTPETTPSPPLAPTDFVLAEFLQFCDKIAPEQVSFEKQPVNPDFSLCPPSPGFTVDAFDWFCNKALNQEPVEEQQNALSHVRFEPKPNSLVAEVRFRQQQQYTPVQ